MPIFISLIYIKCGPGDHVWHTFYARRTHDDDLHAVETPCPVCGAAAADQEIVHIMGLDYFLSEEERDAYVEDQSMQTYDHYAETHVGGSAMSLEDAEKCLLQGQAENETCCICLEPVGTACVQLRACNHAFHRECVLKWLTECSATCPLCKKNVF